MLKEYDVVTLKRMTPAIPLPAGTRGTILIVHLANPPAYEVEFLNDAGASLGTYTVQETELDAEDTRH